MDSKFTIEDATAYLKSVQSLLPAHLKTIVQVVFDTPYFFECPGSTKWHHDYKGGLLIHTAEVVWNCVHLAGSMVDINLLLTAAFLHDIGKTKEYVFKEVDGKTTIETTPYRTKIGHVVGSTYVFLERAKEVNLAPELIDKILHIMLAHHGRLEWRSPVEPETPEAIILHAADQLSAKDWK